MNCKHGLMACPACGWTAPVIERTQTLNDDATLAAAEELFRRRKESSVKDSVSVYAELLNSAASGWPKAVAIARRLQGNLRAVKANREFWIQEHTLLEAEVRELRAMIEAIKNAAPCDEPALDDDDWKIGICGNIKPHNAECHPYQAKWLEAILNTKLQENDDGTGCTHEHFEGFSDCEHIR